MPEPADETQNKAILWKIALGLLIWGAALSLGAFLFRNEHDVRKPLIIMGCVVGFLGFWGVMLWQRQRRQSK